MDNNKLNGHEIVIAVCTGVGALCSILSMVLGVKNPRNKQK